VAKQSIHYIYVSPLEAGGLDEFAFTYTGDTKLPIGTLVSVPFGRVTSLGVVTGTAPKPSFATKPIGETVDGIVLPVHLVELAQWISNYYLASPGAVWQTLLPRGIQRKRRAKVASTKFTLPKLNITLSDEQTAALKTIRQHKFTTYLLHGVTGSGKTQIYLELAAETLAAGKSVIVLVPEIALTPQLVAQFEATFGDIVIATHSRMTEAERHLAWQAALESNSPRVIVGPRSSLFLPVAKVGLIVVDEAHETSYKQEQAPRYDARAVGAKLANLCQATLVMGTATPTLGDLYLVERERIGYVRLTERVNGQPAPIATVVDLRDKTNFGRSRFLTRPLLTALEKTLADGRQALLFINRRGSASSQICGDCGEVSLCPNCQLPLTFHADTAKLICHTCNYQASPAAVCPFCGSANLRYLGGGTKRIEAEVKSLFPHARLARLDKDSATPEYLQQVYKGLHDGSIDILIGTQMIAKGLDLPTIDLVGIVSADTMLHIPDYSAVERTYQLITQVSGRAGRGARPGQVIIQTYTPEHPAIVAAASGDFDGFATAELASRANLAYPPYVFLVKLTCRLKSQSAVREKAATLAKTLAEDPALRVLGPAPAFAEQAGGNFQWHLIIKAKSRTALLEAVKGIPGGWTIDLDPLNLL
jgi:primosomal protein N' (replication factor Y)